MSSSSEPIATKHLRPSARMRDKFSRELALLSLASRQRDLRIVTGVDLDGLPAPAQRYLRFMRVLDRPRDVSFCARWDGQFRLRPHQAWTPCEVWQYNTSLDVARIFHMRLNVGGVVPTYVRDVYAHGGGRMAGKVLDVFNVADDASEQVTIGELVTYLNDALMFAPSLLLGPSATWAAVDEGAFDVSLTDCGHTVMGRVFIDAGGAMLNFSTTDRFGQEPTNKKAGLVRTEWTTPTDGWLCIGDRMRPAKAHAIWHYPSGEFCYAQLDGARMEIAYDVAPPPAP